MSNTKNKTNKQDHNNQQQQHQLPPQQQKTRQEHGPSKRGRDGTALGEVSEYHDHERIETRLTR